MIRSVNPGMEGAWADWGRDILGQFAGTAQQYVMNRAPAPAPVISLPPAPAPAPAFGHDLAPLALVAGGALLLFLLLRRNK